jgi:hypothetical protein
LNFSIAADTSKARPISGFCQQAGKFKSLGLMAKTDAAPRICMEAGIYRKGDPLFGVANVELLKRDLVNIETHILDTGHFALEEDASFIAEAIRRFVQGGHHRRHRSQGQTGVRCEGEGQQ